MVWATAKPSSKSAIGRGTEQATLAISTASGRLWLLGRASAKLAMSMGHLPIRGRMCGDGGGSGASLRAGSARRRRGCWPSNSSRCDEDAASDAHSNDSSPGRSLTEVLVVDCDPGGSSRHNAKVDYPALRALLERRSATRQPRQHFFVGVFVERNDPLGAVARADHLGRRATHRLSRRPDPQSDSRAC